MKIHIYFYRQLFKGLPQLDVEVLTRTQIIKNIVLGMYKLTQVTLKKIGYLYFSESKLNFIKKRSLIAPSILLSLICLYIL